MRNPTYRYNSETCRYERLKVAPVSIVGYVAGLIITASFMLVAILLVHDFFIDSKKEITLRKENQMLETHRVVLINQLKDIESNLGALHKKDKDLHSKFFTETTAYSDQKDSAGREQILLGDANTFMKDLEILKERSQQLIALSLNTNDYFSNNSSLDKQSLKILLSMPTLQPIKELSAENLLSGYGLRINPFHKGLYEHTGIDIAVPRGTSVVATASGKVIEAKRSELQAGYGNFIEIDHGNGFISRYSHLEEISVRVGQQVEKGKIIATSGNSGGSVAPHLHYEIIRGGKNVDPVLYMIEGVTSYQHQTLVSQSHKQNQSLD
jgi:murein DD-endopeptidase MepM/ murein hydrolase activator NlpD